MALVAALVSAVCVAASAWRLVLASAMTALDLGALRAALSDREACARVAAALGDAAPGARWDAALLEVRLADDPGVPGLRDGLARECLLDLDARAGRWARVPRVCASVATSTGLLCATWLLIDGLAAAPGAPAESLLPALDALSMGAVGTTFCAAAHLGAMRARRRQLGAAERLVELARTA